MMEKLGLSLPLIQAPMAGVAGPRLAAAVSNAGALGSLGLGAMTPEAAAQAMRETKDTTPRPFGINVFCHAMPRPAPDQEAAWIGRAAPLFARFGQAPPTGLHTIYPSFVENDAMMRVILTARPAFISFHFGLPRPDQIRALAATGAILAATATCLNEAAMIAKAGLHAIIAQGWEAGGHRGMFDPDAPDEQLSTKDLTRAIAARFPHPIIAAGGLMTGHDLRRALTFGASMGQMGTAFLATEDSDADPDWRAQLHQAGGTVMTRAISGRPARALRNDLTEWGNAAASRDIPAYPRAYDLSKQLARAAKCQGHTGFAAQWAGTGAAQARPATAADLIQTIRAEAGFS